MRTSTPSPASTHSRRSLPDIRWHRHGGVRNPLGAGLAASVLGETTEGPAACWSRTMWKSTPLLTRAAAADVKVAIAPEGPFVYPDVVVSCDERDQPSEYVIRHPTLIVEVLSENTAVFDGGKKFAWYREVREPPGVCTRRHRGMRRRVLPEGRERSPPLRARGPKSSSRASVSGTPWTRCTRTPRCGDSDRCNRGADERTFGPKAERACQRHVR